MLANFFSKSKPVNFIVLFLLFLIYFGITLFINNISFVSAGKEVLLFMIVFSIYNFIVLKNEVTFDNSYAFLFYVILVGFFIKNITIDQVFYANLTSLLFFRKVYSLQSDKNIFSKLFNGGLWLGISFIIEPYSIIFGLLLYISIYAHHGLTYQTLLIPILGFFVPTFLYFTYCFWYDLDTQFWELFSWKITFNYELYNTPYYLFSIIFIGVFTLFSMLLKSPKALAVLNVFRKNWILILFHLFFSGIVFFLVPEKTGSEFLFVLFPTSVILANGLELFQKKWYADIFILLFLVASMIEFFL